MYEKNCIFAFLKHYQHINHALTIYLYYNHLVYIRVQLKKLKLAVIHSMFLINNGLELKT